MADPAAAPPLPPPPPPAFEPAASPPTARAPEPGGLPSLHSQRALVALAVHAQEVDKRLEAMERHLEALISANIDLERSTRDDLRDVREHSARLSDELVKASHELGVRIDDLTDQMRDAATETSRAQRAHTLAETILDLSDSLDTLPVDVDPRS